MERDLREAANAAIQFIDALDEAVDVTFLDFDTNVRIRPLSPPRLPRLYERIRERKAGGMTALYDALGVYLETALEREGQHVVLLYTDRGGDSTSRIAYGKLGLLRLGNVMVYTIGYLENQLSSARMPRPLPRHANRARDGRRGLLSNVPKGNPPVLRQGPRRARVPLHHRVHASRGVARRQVSRRRGQIKKPELRGAKVRTRSGYLAPQR